MFETTIFICIGYLSGSVLYARIFARIFKKETGKTLSDELNEIRIQHAKKLLASTALSINEISKMIGYENECYFSAVFKRYTDTTPSEFRKNQKHSGT